MEPGEIPEDLLVQAPAFYRRMQDWVIEMEHLADPDTDGELDIVAMQRDLIEAFESFVEVILFLGWSDEGTTGDPG